MPSQLTLTLTEPVVFLRSADPSGRHSDPNDPPAIVRGVLTLHVPKPIAISSVDVELTGALTTYFSDGVASRRTDIQEKQKIYSSTIAVFRADQAPDGNHPASERRDSSPLPIHGDGHTVVNLSHPSLSPRGSGRPSAVSIPRDLGPTPPYSLRVQSPNPTHSRTSSLRENPSDLLEELGQALRDDLAEQGYRDRPFDHPRPRPSRPHSIAYCSTLRSGASVVPDEPPRQGSGNLGGASYPITTGGLTPVTHRQPSPDYLSRPRSHSCPRRNSHNLSSPPPAHSRFRLSLNNVLDAVMEVTSRPSSRSRGILGSEERERGRTRVRVVADEHSRESTQVNGPITDTGKRKPTRANTCQPNGYERHFLGLSRVLGFERDNEERDLHHKSKDCAESWKEFKPGTYSYPVSFLLPSNLPPTFSLPRGSLNYIIKAVAHRPGTFTSKLSCQVPLLVVAAPTAGAGEGGVPGDPGPLNIQRQWDGKLAYSFDMSSRLFLLGSQRHLEATTCDAVVSGPRSSLETLVEARAEAAFGTAVLNLTLLPLEKIKIWRLSIVVDQHISYFDARKKLLRDEDKRQVKLLEVQDKCQAEEMSLVDEVLMRKNKNVHVKIPLLPTPLSPDRSPLVQYISPSTDPSILAGPGPYTLSTTIGLPQCGERGLRFTMKHKSSYVKVEHLLRLILRVESIGDSGVNNHEEGKMKCFDITVQTPITVLSCRCVPEYQTLPMYSPATGDYSVCPCQPSFTSPTGHEASNDTGHAEMPPFEREDVVGLQQQSNSSRSSSLVRQGGTRVQHRDGSYSASTSHPPSTPQSSRPPSPLTRYERLVSGLESEMGEAPPSYESLAARC